MVKLQKACRNYNAWKMTHSPELKPWLHPEQNSLPTFNPADIAKWDLTTAPVLDERDAADAVVAADAVEAVAAADGADADDASGAQHAAARQPSPVQPAANHRSAQAASVASDDDLALPASDNAVLPPARDNQLSTLAVPVAAVQPAVADNAVPAGAN